MKKREKDIITEFINKLKWLIELEREAEIESMKREIKRLPGTKRERLGRAILHMNGKIIGEEFGYKVVKYGRRKEFETEINVGDVVLISKGNPLKSDLTGTVVEKGTRFISVALDKVPIWALKDVRLDLYVNDITFRRMIENLTFLSPHGKRALSYYLGLLEPRTSRPENFTPHKELNQSQKKAVSMALGSKDFFLIHGPFGTGKTYTLSEIIIQEVKRGNKILATAESNVAVDNLVENLKNIVKVVRLGHPSRITPSLLETSLFYLLEKDKKYEEVRKLRQEMEKLIELRDREQKPVPQWRRGLRDQEIHSLAKKMKGYRGVSPRRIHSMSRWLELNEKVNSLLSEIQKKEDEIIKRIIDDSDVVLSTNSGAALDFIKNITFDVAVIDEGSQSTIPGVLIPVAKAKRFIIGGDHKQLPPTILSEKAKELSKTLFEGFITRYPQKSTMLLVQYRMNKKLMEFPNKEFYKGRLKAASSVGNIVIGDLGVRPFDQNSFNTAILDDEPLVFVDTSSSPKKYERQRKGSESRENPLEVKIVVKIVDTLIKAHAKEEWIGVISPYDDQIDLLKRRIPYNVEVHTVDGYQGREKEIIIISFVRSNPQGELGFLTDLRRLNVSLTRGRRKLIAVGDSETLKAHATYKRFLEFVREKGRYIRYTK